MLSTSHQLAGAGSSAGTSGSEPQPISIKEKQNSFQNNISEISSNNSLSEIRQAVENAKSQFDSNISNDNLSISNNSLTNNKDKIIELIDKRIDEHMEKLKNHEK